MKFGTVAHDGGTRAAALTTEGWRALVAPASRPEDGDAYAVGSPTADLSAFLAAGGTLGPGTPLGDLLEGAEPVAPLPRPAKVICCGLNYGEHIRETGRELPSHPTLFVKYADSLVGPTDDVSLLAGTDVDWEAELAVVVGATIRHADRAATTAAIAGWTVANDVSVRDWQYRTLQWFQGKAWDDSTPTGPVVVTPDEVDPVAGLTITCRVNGEEVQRASTATLVFDSADLLAYISTFTTLRPGDLVLTGTPGGVGVARDPKRFLADGDVLETEIERIGLLCNVIRLPAHTA
ncbi:2-hydroxyhepta-2,4-diene-1,7-dioate isomerase [Phycicoccus sp. Root563]|uniref:fumarylacetoacetate hydrolase family protein n=1 Tax=Phycicoccus sp. Root563 TaxID=1736562 RepID=UPI00070397E5|nr:fumarylacetoacetate hydrolase family protein [Phycicoccus sp. Root563]KQZ89513.1 2-hydroxyhepta-2,4-diene-1,7-dioate isomerase [Phycicoccus sp. Root563]